jgi:hypothetical protein
VEDGYLMEDLVVWLIIGLFYAPLHYLMPVLVVILTDAGGPEQRRRRLIGALRDCTLSMLAALGLALWLAQGHLQLAMAALALSMAAPYLGIYLRGRWRRTGRE